MACQDLSYAIQRIWVLMVGVTVTVTDACSCKGRGAHARVNLPCLFFLSFFPFFHLSAIFSMSVYLDDLPSSRSEDTTLESKENIPSSKKDAKQVDSNNNDSTSKDGKSLKRQLSIADMFSKKPRDDAKRLKTETESSSSVMRKTVSLGGIPTLNSIPLNLDAYRASLKPEELALLKLELETMGKSWFVQNPFTL